MLGFVKTCTLVFILQNYFQTTGSIKCYICNMMKQNTVQVSKKLKEGFIFIEYLKTLISFNILSKKTGYYALFHVD